MLGCLDILREDCLFLPDPLVELVDALQVDSRETGDQHGLVASHPGVQLD
jgi:hypothetical protein